MLQCEHKAGKVCKTGLSPKKYKLSLTFTLDTKSKFVLIFRGNLGGIRLGKKSFRGFGVEEELGVSVSIEDRA